METRASCRLRELGHAHEEIAGRAAVEGSTSIELEAKRRQRPREGVAGTLNERLQWRYPDAECERCSHHAFVPDQPDLEAHRAFDGVRRDEDCWSESDVAYAVSGLKSTSDSAEIYLLAAAINCRRSLRGKAASRRLPGEERLRGNKFLFIGNGKPVLGPIGSLAVRARAIAHVEPMISAARPLVACRTWRIVRLLQWSSRLLLTAHCARKRARRSKSSFHVPRAGMCATKGPP